MAVLFVLLDDWLRRRQMLTALGVEGIDVLDDMVAPPRNAAAPAADAETRRAQVEQFIAATGGG